MEQPQHEQSVGSHATNEFSPSDRIVGKTPLKQSLTPTTLACSESVPSTASTPNSNGCSPPIASGSVGSERTIRVALPSPSRPRLDPHYTARLIPQPQPQYSSSAFSGSLIPPPGITRDSDASVFRPSSILSTTSDSSTRNSAVPLSANSIPRSSHPVSELGMSPSYRRSSGSVFGSPIKYSTGSWNRKSKSDLGSSDRFIPSRATSNLNLSLWDGISGRSPSPRSTETGGNDANTNRTAEQDDSTDTGSHTARSDSNSVSQQSLLNTLLRSELLGENLDPLSAQSTNYSSSSRSPVNSNQPLQEGGNHLHFQSPRSAYQASVFENSLVSSAVINSFSLTPVRSAASQRLMAAPQKRKRRISKVPFKVLDAPALQDDFYLNLVDWSSQNVLAVGLGSCVYLWSACTSKVTKLCDLAQSEDIVTSVSWAQRGTHLAVGTNRGEVLLWDTIKCKKVRTMPGHSARVGTLAWNGPVLASGSRDRLIYLRDVRSQFSSADRLAAHKQEVCGLKWSFDEPAFLASGGNDNQLHVVDSRNPTTPIHRFSDHTAAVKAIAWSPHQHGLLASGGGTADRCIRFWNTLSGTDLNCVDTGSQVCNLAWSQNCNEIVSTHGYSLNQIVVWRYPSMSKVVTLTGHTYRVLYLAMSPDGSTIVTGAGDETLRFWQVFPGPRSESKNNAGGLLFPNTIGSVIR